MNFNLTFKIFIFPCFPCHQEWRSVFTLIIVNVTMSSPSSGLPLSIYAAAAAAKSLQSCPTLCNPIDSSPPGSPVPGILQARALEWVAISFSSLFIFFLKLSFILSFLFPGLYLWLPWWLRCWRIHLQCGRPEFDPWVGKIPWRRKWLLTPVF